MEVSGTTDPLFGDQLTEFEVYLGKKLIAAEQFQKDLPVLFERLAKEYREGGEASFDARYKFHINNFRLQYPSDGTAM